MDSSKLMAWLRKKKSKGIMTNCLLGTLSLIGGLIVLFVTFWFTYLIILIAAEGFSSVSELIFGKKLHLGHEGRLICSGVFILLLFIQNLRTSSWHWGQYPQENYADDPRLMEAAGDLKPFAAILAHPQASANMVADVLLSGPRLVMGMWGSFTQALRFKQLDEQACVGILTKVYSRNDAVPYEELNATEWKRRIEQLRCIDGVLFLKKGLFLSEELRNELNGLH